MSTRIPRLLDPAEIRVLGSLLEKEQATPESYPLTLNALVAACNQRTNREPVTQLSQAEVAAALDRLRQEVLVWRTESSRSERWKQSVERRWELDPAAKALLTLLLLRGPQTAGELRSRSDRLHPFASLAEVEAALERLAGAAEPLVRELGRRPGQKETRWTHLVGDPSADEQALASLAAVAGPPAASAVAGPPAASTVAGPPAASAVAGPRAAAVSPAVALVGRVERLEEIVTRLSADLEELRRRS